MPRLSDLTPAPTPSRGTFVGREAELRAFRTSVRHLRGSEPPPGNDPVYPHFFLTHGEGGMGKTALVREWRLVAGEEGMPDARIVLVDLDSAHCPTITAFAQILADRIAKQHPGFDAQYRAACQRRAELAPRRDELHAGWQRWQSLLHSEGSAADVVATLRRRLAHGETQQAAFGLYTPAPIALDMQDARRDLDALSSFYDQHRRGPDSFDELLRRALGPDAAFVADDERALGHALGRDLYNLAEAAPLLLLLDTYERADQHDEWLRETVLAEPNTNLLVVIAGREKLDGPYQRKFGGDWSNWASYYDLNQRRLEAPAVRAYLRQRLTLADDPPDDIVEQVLAISRGIPLAVQALGDQLTRGNLDSYRDLADQPLDQHAVITAMTERFLMYLAERPSDAPDVAAQKRNDRQRIRALALLRPGQPPDEQQAGCLWGVPHASIQAAFTELEQRHSFVFRAGLFQMHELVHQFVRASMLAERRRAADWPLFESGLRRALALVDERLLRAERRTADPDERYADAEWRDGLLDRLNLLLWLDEDDMARRLLLNRWIEARHNAPALAAELSALAAELAPQTPGWQRLVAAVRDDEHAVLAAFAGALEQHALAVLYYLQAGELTAWPENKEDFERINQQIVLLEQSHSIAPEWKPIHEALAKALYRRGTFLLKQGEHTSVLADYDRSLKLRPDDADTLMVRGIAKKELGDLPGALADYNRSLELRRDDPDTLHNRGNVKHKLGDYAGALIDYDEALRLRPDDETFHNRGGVKGDLGDLAGQLADYDHALRLKPDNPDRWYNRGIVKRQSGDLAGALEDYDQALTLRPDYASALHNRGFVKRHLGDEEGALADLDRAVELRPDDPAMLYGRGILKHNLDDFLGALAEYNRALDLHPDKAETLTDRGTVKQQLGDLSGALADYDHSLELRSDDSKTLFNRGIVKAELSDLAGALVDYNRSLALRPGNPDTLHNRGKVKAELGDLAGALVDYDAALNLRPDSPETLHNRGSVKYNLDDFSGALADYDAALRLHPDDPDRWYNRGIAKKQLGDLAGALADYDQALRIQPNHLITLSARDLIIRQLGDLTGELIDYVPSLEVQSEGPGMLYNRGKVKSDLGDYAGALADYDRALELRPDDADTLGNRGGVKKDLGDLHGALADYTAALMLRPDYAGIINNRGLVKQDLGDLHGALADYDYALMLRPDQPDMLTNRGKVKSNLGDYAGALTDYNRSLELRPDNPQTLTSRGLARIYAGDAIGGLADCEQSLTLRPNHPATLNNRGLAKQQLGDFTGALADCDRSLELEPNEPVAFNNRGLAKHRMGDLSGALADYNYSLKLRPHRLSTLMCRVSVKIQLGDWKGAFADILQIIKIRVTGYT